MKKLVVFVLTAVMLTACSKDKTEVLTGTWKATSMKILYKNSDGSPYRDQQITEDFIYNNPDLSLVFTETTVTSIGLEATGEEVALIHGADYLDISLGGETQRLNYAIDGKTLVLSSTEHQVNVYSDAVVDRVETIMTLQKR